MIICPVKKKMKQILNLLCFLKMKFIYVEHGSRAHTFFVCYKSFIQLPNITIPLFGVDDKDKKWFWESDFVTTRLYSASENIKK